MSGATSGFTGKVKAIAIAVSAALLAVLIGVICWNISAWYNRSTTQQSTDSIREEVIAVTKLVPYEYNFTQIISFRSTNNENPFKIDIPFSENLYIATIDGFATITVNADEIVLSPSYSLDGAVSKVQVLLPHAYVQEPVTLDHGSLKVLESRDGFFNPVTAADYNELLVLTNEEQIKKVQEGDVLQRADERIKDLIAAQLQSIYGQDIEIAFTYFDE